MLLDSAAFSSSCRDVRSKDWASITYDSTLWPNHSRHHIVRTSIEMPTEFRWLWHLRTCQVVWFLLPIVLCFTYMFTVQVEMKTATSSVVSYWRVPFESEPAEDCLIVDPKVGLLGVVMGSWQRMGSSLTIICLNLLHAGGDPKWHSYLEMEPTQSIQGRSNL